MRIGLFRDEYNDNSKYREYPCCEINLDAMTSGTDYEITYNKPTTTVAGVEVKLYYFRMTSAGVSKIGNKVTRESDLILPNFFWQWNETLSKRSVMGQHFTSHTFTEQPDDWNTALYWKYYTYTADNNFEQYKNPTSTTFNAGTTYYTCDDVKYAPQAVYYAANDYATSFTIGQFVGDINDTWFGYGSGAVSSGYMAGAGLGGTSDTSRTRVLALKRADAQYTGYTGMSAIDANPLRNCNLNTWVLVGTPAQNLQLKTNFQMAHITYNSKEYIGWGTILYDPADESVVLESRWTCVNIEAFGDAIKPDPKPYNNGVHAGGDGTGGIGSGLPDGDHMVATELTGVIPLAGTSSNGLHAYVINSTNLMALNDYLWLKPSLADISDALKRWVFNPFNGILGLHRLPHVLMPKSSDLGEETAIHLAGTLCDGNDSDPLIKGYPITNTHFTSCDANLGDPDYTFTLNLDNDRLPYNSFQDFANTSVTLHIPFCGDISIDPDKCIGGRVEVYMQCDVLTGNMGVQVQAYDMNGNDHICGTMTGNCAYHIPISSSEYNVGGMMSSLGQMGMSAISGNFIGMLGGATGMLQNRQQTMISGQLGGNQGWLGFLGTTITVTYTQFVDEGDTYMSVNGKPSADDTKTVKDFTGYGEIKVNPDMITGANDVEKDKIRQILETGVIV